MRLSGIETAEPLIAGECPLAAEPPCTSAGQRGSEYAQLSRQIKQAGLLERRSGYYLWKIAVTAVLLIVEARKGFSANQLRRTIWGQHKGSYKTAWYLCHRIRAAMREVDYPALGGTVEVDETYIGGKMLGRGSKAARDAKEVVIGLRQRGGDVRFFHAEDAKQGTLAKYIKENVSQDVEVIMTDELPAYPGAIVKAGMKDVPHKTVNHSAEVYVDGDVTTNGIESAFSLLKRGIVGSWHKVSAKHLSAYLDEMTFRFNNRNNPYLFRDTLTKLVQAPVLEYKKLIEQAA